MKTARTGYIQRRLESAMNDISAEYDGTVRKSDGSIIQFKYGSDGFGAEYLVKCRLSGVDKSLQEFQDSLQYNFMAYKSYLSARNCKIRRTEKSIFQKTYQEEFDKLRHLQQHLNENRRTLLISMHQKPEVNVWLPLDIHREVFSVKNSVPSERDALKIDYVFEKLQMLLQKFATGNLTVEYALRYGLYSKHVFDKYRLSREQFDQLVDNITMCFERALVHPGEMVGALAAENIGEPATQMTLNTFHR